MQATQETTKRARKARPEMEQVKRKASPCRSSERVLRGVARLMEEEVSRQAEELRAFREENEKLRRILLFDDDPQEEHALAPISCPVSGIVREHKEGDLPKECAPSPNALGAPRRTKHHLVNPGSSVQGVRDSAGCAPPSLAPPTNVDVRIDGPSSSPSPSSNIPFASLLSQISRWAV